MHSYASKILQAKKDALERGDEETLKAMAGGGKDVITRLIKANMQSTKEKDRLEDDAVIGNVRYSLLP
jgi:hypothetical protein